MRKTNALFLIMAVAFMSGCADSSAAIRKSSSSSRSDVFKELTDGGAVPQGYADLRITSSLKTHRPGVHLARDIHGTPDYGMLLNIDGQAIQLQGSLREENVEPHGLRDPEGGDGIRYHFDKKLRLKAGTHKVVIAVPADDLAVEREIALTEGSSNSLVLEPAYRGTAPMKHPVSYSSTSFKEGIRGLSVLLNGKQI